MCIDDIILKNLQNGFKLKCKCDEGEAINPDYFKGIVDEETLAKLKAY